MMKDFLFILILAASCPTWASETKSVVFPGVSLKKLSEATVKAVKLEIDSTMPQWDLVQELGAPTLIAISQEKKGSKTVYELELPVEIQSSSGSFRTESLCIVELNGSLEVLYASCEGYEPEPWD